MDWNAHQDVVPRPAAAVILLHGRPARVLLALRNKRLAFMGGHYAFPGGRVEPEDPGALVTGADTEDQARSIAAAAREVFEETGILLGAPADLPREALHHARVRLTRQELPFAEVMREFSVRLDARQFVPAGTWVTPPFSPIRYNTQYFLHELHGTPHEEALGEDAEIVRLDWMTPGEARQRWHRGEIRISTPVAFALRRLAAFPMPDALPWLARTPGDGGISPHLFEPRRGLHILPLRTATLPPATHTNTIIIGEQELLIVDPGASDADEQERLCAEVDHLCALGGRVKAILLTHSHPDHVAAAPRLRLRYEAPVLAHPLAARQLEFAVDAPLLEGDLLELDDAQPWRVRCLHTPGHDPGHVALLEETTQTLLCGDMAANPGTILIAPEYGGDMTAYLHSLDRLLQNETWNLLVPAHGLPLWGHAGREKLRELGAHRLAREARISAGWNAGARTEQELLERAYDDVSEQALPLARMQLHAHLIRLGLQLEHVRL